MEAETIDQALVYFTSAERRKEVAIEKLRQEEREDKKEKQRILREERYAREDRDHNERMMLAVLERQNYQQPHTSSSSSHQIHNSN